MVLKREEINETIHFISLYLCISASSIGLHIQFITFVGNKIPDILFFLFFFLVVGVERKKEVVSRGDSWDLSSAAVGVRRHPWEKSKP